MKSAEEGALGRAERQFTTRRGWKRDDEMPSQRKRLRDYLKARGMEVQVAEDGVDFTIRETWGELNVPDLMDQVLTRENFD